jgi:hypothetical protein
MRCRHRSTDEVKRLSHCSMFVIFKVQGSSFNRWRALMNGRTATPKFKYRHWSTELFDEGTARACLPCRRENRVRGAFAGGHIGNKRHAIWLYRRPELAYPLVNLMCVDATIAQDQPNSRRTFQVARRQGNCRNALLSSLSGNRYIVSARG